MTALLTLLALSPLLTPAAAEDVSRAEAFDACLEAARLPPRRPVLWVVGPGSRTEVKTYGAITTGLWELSCEGEASFGERVIATFPQRPPDGRVINEGIPKTALRCFVDTCAFPAGVCTGRSGSDPVLQLCGGGALTEAALTAGPDPDAPPPKLPAAPTEATAQVSATQAAPKPAAPKPAAPKPAAPKLATAGSTAAPQRVIVTRNYSTPGAGDDPLALPNVPTTPCDTPGALKDESRARIELGNQAEVSGALEDAAAEYRAALTLSPCNAIAWINLGMLAARMDRPDRAVQALSVGLEMNPRHYGAATALGEAYEALGQSALAEDAFRAALDLRPDHQPAQEGLRRVSGTD